MAVDEVTNKITKKYLTVFLLDASLDFDKPYNYLPLTDEVMYLGQLVEVPFGKGNSLRRAVIVDQADSCQYKQVKQVASTLISRPVYLPDQIELAREMKRRYFCTYGQALKTISPPAVFAVGKKKSKACRLTDRDEALELLSGNALTSLQQERVVEMLVQLGSALVQEVTQACQVSVSTLNTLAKKNIIEFYQQKVDRKYEDFELWQEDPIDHLNSDQKAALEGVLDLKDQDLMLREAMLLGVTGSGKTEVYLRLAEQVLAQGQTAIVLVPEISLTPLMISRFLNRFSDQVAIWHSRLTATQRFEQWEKILRGDKKIVVGARSAIFAPLKNIGLIVIDEEQENSYISESIPRYKAHEIGRIRSVQHKAVLVLGSATPSIESFYRTDIKKSRLFSLPQRAKAAPLPRVHLVQMKEQYGRDDFDHVFSQQLAENLAECFAEGGQAMLFLNRRGLSSALQCRDCGQAVTCPHCEVALTRHLNRYDKNYKRLICHYCGHVEPVTTTCPHCGSTHMESCGMGTQMVEDAFNKRFPSYKAIRMDYDTTIGPDSHQNILDSFRQGEANCLIGTQMIAKGHDFPNVRTVGILGVDSMLYTGSYKAEERAFQLITQAAGRSGRSDRRGDVFVQGFNLDNYAIHNAAKQDYANFYKIELQNRLRAGFPPFLEIGLAMFQAWNEERAKLEATSMYRMLEACLKANPEQFSNTFVFPPAPAPIAKLRNKYRYRLIVKSDQKLKISRLFHLETRRPKGEGVSLYLDINPEHML